MGEMEAAVCMTDHFDKIQKLPDPIPGCPNFRRVPGFKVYCSGQPTIEGFEKALEKVCGTIYPKDGPIIWFNLRQEPTVYVNGESLNDYKMIPRICFQVTLSAPALPTRLESTPSWGPSPGTSSRPRRLPSSGSARAGRVSEEAS